MLARRTVVGLILFLGLLIIVLGTQVGAQPLASHMTDPEKALAAWTFQGRVFRGDVGDESHPIAGVTVEVWGANNPYPDTGTLIRSTTTDPNGWYGLTVYDDDGSWEFYSLRESDPAGYTSVGATTISGTVREPNWIEYVISLDGKVLTGNKFWDEQPLLQGRVYRGSLGDESTPIPGVTVELYCSQDENEVYGTLVVTATTNAGGWYGLPPQAGCEYLNIVETVPTNHTSVGATTVSGTVKSSIWIQYTTPLDGKTLTGNKFWSELEGSAGWLDGYVMDAGLVGEVPVCTEALVTVEPIGIDVPADLATGYYGPVPLPEDTYTLVAAAPGYSLETVNGVVVTTDVTTTQNFHLQRPVAAMTPTHPITVSALVGQGAVYTLTVANQGSQPLEVEFAEGPGGDLPWVWVDPISATVPAAGQIDVEATFQCTEPGDLIGWLEVIHDDPCQGPLLAPLELHCQFPPPEWESWIDGMPWGPDFSITRETSDTVQVVNVFTYALPSDLTLQWNPDRLQSLETSVDQSPPVYTITDIFHVEPCTWTATLLTQTLQTPEGSVQRPVVIEKTPPDLWLTSANRPLVYPGDIATFTLSYGNAGGYENGVWIWNEFPPAAPYVWSIPPADEVGPAGLSARWNVGDLAGGDQGEIQVAVAISPTLPPEAQIEIGDWIFDHADQEWDSTLITYTVAPPPEVEWAKWADGMPWSPDLGVGGQTTDTFQVVDVLSGAIPFELVEHWNPAELELVNWSLEPDTWNVIREPGTLILQVEPTQPEVVTLTKQFRLLPCNWEATILEEALFVAGSPDPLVRPLLVEKIMPLLWIESHFPPEVQAGRPAWFALEYGNHGGREFDAVVRNNFPDEAPFVSSDPPPDRQGPGGSWAEWDLPPLETGQGGLIEVQVGIAPGLPPSTTVEIWDGILDHAGELRDQTEILLHVASPVVFPEGEWPWYAQGEISVDPEPPIAGYPTRLCAEVINLDPTHAHPAVLQFAVSPFGVGLPFEPVGATEVIVPPAGSARGCIIWVPPSPDDWFIEARIITGDSPDRISQRNVDVNEPLMPETAHERVFPLHNPFDHPVTFTLQTIAHLPGWSPSLYPAEVEVLSHHTQPITLTVTPPADMPEDGQPIVDVEVSVGPETIGGFRKIYRPPVPLHRFPDPPYAEREITVTPYPLRAGEPTEVCVDMRNPTSDPQDVMVQFSWAHFGIGLPFTPINGLRPVHLPPHSMVRECIHWIPPIAGQACLQVELLVEGHLPQSSRLNLDVDEPLRPETPHDRVFEVRNPFADPVTITLGLIPHLEGWTLELSQDVLTNMGFDETRPVTLTVTPPAGMPEDGQPIVDVEAYVDAELIGGFRKLYRPPVPIHRPGEPIYAESEIFVHPYPPRAHEPTELGVELRNPTGVPQEVTVQFSWARFGIGLPFTPINGPLTVTVPANGTARPTIWWVPPFGGQFCLQVEVQIPGLEQRFFSQRNIDLDEPLQPETPHSRVFQVRNPFDHPVTVTLGLIPHLPDWGLELSSDVLPGIAPGYTRTVTLTVTPPADLPEDGQPIVDVEAYAGMDLIGGFRKVYRPPVPIHRPRDPVFAESEIGIDPYPVLPGEPAQLSVELFNPTDQDQVVTATFEVASFGIGLPFTTSHIVPNPIRIFVPAHGAARGHVVWHSPTAGKFCVRVTLQVPGHEPFSSSRNIDVGEPLHQGQPHSLDFPVGAWPYDQPVTITLGLVNHRESWPMSLSDTTLPAVEPDTPVTVTLTVTPPLEARLGTGLPIADVEAYVDGQLLGGFRKLDRPPVPLHKPHEKGYAETEIIVDPYPPQRGVETTVSAVLQNTSDTPITVDLEFGWAQFGAGIPFTVTGMSPYTASLTLSPHMTATAGVTWTPEISGHQCLLVHMTDPLGRYEPQGSQRNVDVEEQPPCNTTKVFTFTVYNDSPLTVTLDIGLITFNVPANWQVTVSPTSTVEIGPYQDAVITVAVTIPCPSTSRDVLAWGDIAALQAEAGGVPTIDVEAYRDGQLVGGIELQFSPKEMPTIYLPLILRSS